MGVMKKAPPVGSQFTDGLPSKSEIFDYWKERLPGLGFLIDWGEPGCWACGFHYGARYDIKRSDADWAEISTAGIASPFSACYIIPGSLGGTSEVANLF
jgi:hypothetical protein